MHEKDGPDEDGQLDEGSEARIEPHGEKGAAHQVRRDHVYGQSRESEARLRGAQQSLQPALRHQQGKPPKKQAGPQVHAEGVENEVALGFKTAKHRREAWVGEYGEQVCNK